MATQNVGSDWPEHRDDLGRAVDARCPSSPRPSRRAGTPWRARRPWRRRASLSELGRRSRISSITGRRARSEVPKSPANAPADEGEVLLDVGPVEAEVAAGVGVVLLGGRHRQDQVQRIAGGPGQHEDDDGQDRQRHQRLKRRARTKRITGAASPARYFARGELVEEEVVHHGAGLPLAERLRRWHRPSAGTPPARRSARSAAACRCCASAC